MNSFYKFLMFLSLMLSCSFSATAQLPVELLCDTDTLSAYLILCEEDSQLKLDIDFDGEIETEIPFSLDGELDDNNLQKLQDDLKAFLQREEIPVKITFDTSASPNADQISFEACLLGDQLDCCADGLLFVDRCDTDDKDEGCLTFDELPLGETFGGEQYEAGSYLFYKNGINVFIDSFQYGNGTQGFFSTEVVAADYLSGFELASAQYLFISNTNITFDFSQTPSGKPAQQICFDFFDGGGEENISVNGSETIVLNSFAQLDTDSLSAKLGVDVHIEYTLGGEFVNAGTLCLDGEIKTLSIGGQEFGLDNLCFSTSENKEEEEEEEETEGDCLSFNDLPDASYGGEFGQAPGAKVFSAADVDVRVFSLQQFDWSEGFGTLEVKSSTEVEQFTQADGQLLYLDNIATIFSFANVDEDIESISIDFYDLGGGLNLAVNGGLPQILAALTPGGFPLSGNVDIYVELDSDFGSSGTLTLKGDVRALLIGGTGLLLDNLCFNKKEEEPCELGELILEPTPCDGREFYYALDISGKKETSNHFYLYENGQEVGKYRYAELPIKVGPYPAPTEPGNEFMVVDSKNDSCFAVAYSEFYSCVQSDSCKLNVVEVYDISCNDDTTYNLTFDYDYFQRGDSLLVETKGGFVRYYIPDTNTLRLEGLPLTGLGYDKLVISNPSLENCFAVAEYLLPCFTPVDTCTLYSAEIEDINCYEPLPFFDLKVNIRGEADGRVLVAETASGQIRRFEFASNTILLSELALSLTGLETIKIYDPNSPDCAVKVEFELPCVPLPCVIEIAEVDEIECTDNGTYHLTLSYEAIGSSNVLLVKTAGGFEQRIDAEKGKVRLTNIPYTGARDVIKIYDTEFSDCYYEIPFEVNCENKPECDIFYAEVDDLECQDSVYHITLYYAAETSSDTLIVRSESGFETTIDAREEKVRLSNIPLNGLTDALKIYDPANPDCIKYVQFRTKCENEQNCIFYGVRAETEDCDDGKFYAELKIDAEGGSEEGFLVFGRGQIFGPFSYYQDERIVVGPFVGNGVTNYEFFVVDMENPSCFGYVDMGTPDCEEETEECTINKLDVDVVDCNPDGSYRVKVDFDYKNNETDTFRLFTGNGMDFLFTVQELPLDLDLFLSEDVRQQYLQVCFAQDSTDCCADKAFRLPECKSYCDEFPLAVKAIPTDCDTAGQFYIDLRFDFDLTVALPLFLEVNGEFYDSLNIAADSNRVGPFSATEKDKYYLEFISPFFPDCPVKVEVEPKDCKQEEEACKIKELDVEVACNDDGTYHLFVEMEYDNEIADIVYVSLPNGMDTTVSLENFPLEVDLALNDSIDAHYLQVCFEQDSIDCCKETRFRLPACKSDCDEPPLIVEAIPTECDTLGQFYIDLKFDFLLTVVVPLTLEVNGEFYDSLSLTGDNILVGPFNAADKDEFKLKLTSLFRPDCPIYMEVEPTCADDDQPGKDCLIDDLTIEPLYCNPDGSYHVLIDFYHENANNDFFDLWQENGDSILGYFPLAELPLELDIDFNDKETPVLAICINDRPECCIRRPITLPDCDADSSLDCQLDQLEVFTMNCDSLGNFEIGINGITDSASINSYTFFVNGVKADSLYFGINQTLVLSPFGLQDTSVNLLTIIDSSHTDCIKKFELTPTDCLEEKVWPGDANRDRVVNHFDLLNLGIAFGFQGPARFEASVEWDGLPSSSWGKLFDNGLNYMHADCNGDGLIDARDINVIEMNYGLSSGTVLPVDTLPSTALDPVAYLDIVEGEVLPDSTEFQIPIMIGTADKPMKDIYGVAFTIEFDAEVIDPASVYVTYPTSWFGQPDVNLISVDYTHREEGRIDIALSRTDQNEVSGYGPVAVLNGIRDDIAGRSHSEVKVRHGIANNLNQKVITLGAVSQQLQFEVGEDQGDDMLTPEKVGKIDLRRSLNIYPNPTDDIINVESRYAFDIEEMQLISADGKVCGAPVYNSSRISLYELPRGMYFLRIRIGEFIIHEKVFKK